MDKIYEEYFPKIYYWSITKTDNKEDAEDLTNSIFVALFEYLKKDIDIQKMDNLIWKIAHNIWYAKTQKYLKEKDNLSYEEEISSDYQIDDIDKIIFKEIVTNLDDFGFTLKEYKAFQLYYLLDLSISEISKQLATNENNVKYYLYKARKKVKEKYHYE